MTKKELHHHDWRVDPSQVIFTIRDSSRVRVACAGFKCGAIAIIMSPAGPPANPKDIRTWRPYLPKSEDRIRILPDHLGRTE